MQLISTIASLMITMILFVSCAPTIDVGNIEYGRSDVLGESFFRICADSTYLFYDVRGGQRRVSYGTVTIDMEGVVHATSRYSSFDRLPIRVTSIDNNDLDGVKILLHSQLTSQVFVEVDTSIYRMSNGELLNNMPFVRSVDAPNMVTSVRVYSVYPHPSTFGGRQIDAIESIRIDVPLFEGTEVHLEWDAEDYMFHFIVLDQDALHLSSRHFRWGDIDLPRRDIESLSCDPEDVYVHVLHVL